MSPELEKLLEALYEKLTCPPEEKSHRVATFERLLDDAMARRPGTSRDELLNALQDRLSGLLPGTAQTTDSAARRVSGHWRTAAIGPGLVRHHQIEVTGVLCLARQMRQDRAIGQEHGIEVVPPVHRERRAAYHDVLPVVRIVRLGDKRVGGEGGGGQLRVEG